MPIDKNGEESEIMKNRTLAYSLIISGLLSASFICSGAGTSGAAAPAGTQETQTPEKVGDIVEFDKTIHNFGDVMLSDGALSCTFTMKNISDKPVVIYNVVTSCGCTDVKWTREPVLPGKTGTISAVYTNDEGPYPFDKSLTAYISGIGRPVILRIRGIAHEKQLSLEELYPERLLAAGVKSLELKCGNIEQGGSRSDEVNIANLSGSPVKVTFTDVTPGLSLDISPDPIPARSTAVLRFTVTAQKGVWGRNLYYATPVIDGKPAGRQFAVQAFTKENFSGLTAAQKAAGARPVFETNTCTTGKLKQGEKAVADFTFTNAGKDDFVIYKADIDWPKATATLPGNIKSGYDGTVRITVDTSGMPKGEMLVTATMTTNSPSRPIVNLFVTGWIE